MTFKELQQLNPKTYYLQSNYRSGQFICDMANRLIKGVDGYKDTISVSGGGIVDCVGFKNPNEELVFIAKKIRECKLDEGIAVLLRTNDLCERYANGLMAYGIPIAKTPYVHPPSDWPMVTTLLMLLQNPFNDLLAQKFIRLFKPMQAQAVIEDASKAMQSLNARCLHLPEIHTADEALTFIAGRKPSQESWEKLDRISANLADDASLQALIFALDESVEQSSEGVHVGTIHSAKGMEFGAVFIPAFEDGIYPLPSEKSLDEPRRIVYVAITRAKTELYITYCAERFHNFKMLARQPSPFLEDLR